MNDGKVSNAINEVTSCEAGGEPPGDPDQKDAGAIEEVLSTADNRRLRLKADMVVLPLITIAATMAALDKNALGFAAVFHLKQDLHLKGQEYSWLGSIVYFGYMIAQFPLGWLFTKVPLGKFIGLLLLTWGVLICSIVACNNFSQFAAIRFLLGLTEAGVVPANMILTGLWYQRKEQPLRTAIWYNTLAGLFGGILAYAIANVDGPYPTWKMIFLIYGSITLGLGLITLLLLPDVPAKAWFYNEKERKLKVIRIASNQTGQRTKSPVQLTQVTEALRDPKFYVMALFVLAWCIVNAGVTNFNPLIISGFGFSPRKTTLMSTPQAGVALVSQLVATTIALYLPNMRCILWALSCIPGLVGAIMIHTLDPVKHRNASLAGVYLMGFFNVSYVMAMSLVSSNSGGTTKKAFATTSFSVLYSVGNIYGPQLFLESQAPHYPLGIFAMMVSFAVQALCAVAYMLLCIWENRRRDREYGQVYSLAAAGLEASDNDWSDGKNKAFRYCW